MPSTSGVAKTGIVIIALLASTGALAQRAGGPPSGVGGGRPDGAGGGRPDTFPGGGNSGDQGGSRWGSPGRPDGTGRPVLESRTAPKTLETNSHLSGALNKALGKSGVTLPPGGLTAACEGFRNLGGCLSALHVADNLALPGGFDALKAAMTSGDKLSLGKAIKQLKPDADAKLAEKQAKKQARTDLDSANGYSGD